MAKQKLRGVVSALIILLALGFIIYRLTYKPAPPSQEGLYRLIGTRLGEIFSNYLPEQGKVIVFTSQGDESYVEGLEKSLSAKKIMIQVVSTSPIETESESGYEDKLLKFYNQQLSENPDISGLIFLSRFPQKAQELDIFLKESRPKIALLTNMSPELTGLIRQGYVQTLIAGTPEVHTMKKGEKMSPEETFKQRFMLVTPDNLEEIIRKYPQYAP